MSASSAGVNVAGLLLVSIPLATIVGNLLVILSVLRYRALQSAINYLILGLAVADLFVALFVMPFAVYVHVYRGLWQLGNLMCDFYTAADVACSTASILLLAVISFDRYRAVSRPIQYSRQAQNVKRVIGVICAIWIISLALASPIVFGVNVRPPDANPNECRFYNAEFSIGSSFISFVIPCILVLFVYIRIMVALKKREKAAKLRRLKQTTISGESGTREEEEAGRIVAGPVMNVMMMALPSMSRHMRRFERHRQAIEAAGEDADEPEAPAAALLRRVLGPGILPASSSLSQLAKERDVGGSNSPRSSIDESLSENIHVISNDFISEGCVSNNRPSSLVANSESSGVNSTSHRSKKFGTLSRNYSMRWKLNCDGSPGTPTPRSASFNTRDKMFPSLLRSISRRSPRLFRSMSPARKEEAMVLQNPVPTEMARSSQTESETISASRCEIGMTAVSRSTTANSEILGSPEPTLSDSQPTVTFAPTVRHFSNSPETQRLREDQPSSSSTDPELAVKLFSRGSVSHGNPALNAITRDSDGSDNERKDSVRSDPTSRRIARPNGTGSERSSGGGGLAGKLVKRTLRHEQSLKRKVSKAQRKEKRATKTLGVVVGVFLICWVPFFAINIVNAVCILAHKQFCQVGFDLFFYCTWIGYMNSFMNPIIYTIFNTEFRRAFKALLFGRQDHRAHLLNKQVHL